MKNILKLKFRKIVPVNEPKLSRSDISYINKAAKSGWVSSSGKYIDLFEKKFAKIIGSKYATAVSNGTAALEIALKSININKGDEVIMPNFTIISNALSVIKLGAKPIFVDCEKYDWNLNFEQIKKKTTNKTRAIIATHIYNFPCNIKKIKNFCISKKIFLIEDAAEVIGLKIKNKMCGSFGDISTFSFYANKNITTGEGGMILTNKKKIIEKCKSLKNLCFGKKNRFNHDDIGWNYRFTNIQAALGYSQLKRINKIVKKKMLIGSLYYKYLKKNKKLYIPPPVNKYGQKNIYWIVGILIKKKLYARSLSKILKKFNIETRPFFYPMNKQSVFKKLGFNFFKDKFVNSEYISNYGLYLPSSLNIKKNQIFKICSIINKIV